MRGTIQRGTNKERDNRGIDNVDPGKREGLRGTENGGRIIVRGLIKGCVII
jgi:hypothetical protein